MTGDATMLFRSKNGKVPAATLDVEEIIRAEGVVKSYKTDTEKLTVLKGIDVSVRKGEMVAIMGPIGLVWIFQIMVNDLIRRVGGAK
jgi:ABC-type transporter Mla maintaining outer membrane lipid asymmetry ATPase subunit MlaF